MSRTFAARAHRAPRRTALAPTLALATIAALAVPDASAFDGRRDGFLVGLGLGVRASNVTFTDFSQGEDREVDEPGAALALRIGGGLSDRLSLYYGLHVGTFEDLGATYGMGLSGVGGAFHLRADGGTPYVHALVGAASLSPDDELADRLGDDESATGAGALAGVGYAFASRLSVELNALSVSVEDGFLGRTSLDAVAAEAVLRYDWY